MAPTHHCEWNRVGSVFSTMGQQLQLPSGWPGPASGLPHSSSGLQSGLSAEPQRATTEAAKEVRKLRQP